MGCFITKEALCKSNMEEQKWFNTCTTMSLGVTKANGWLHGDTSSMMVQVKHYTNRVNLNEI